MSFLKEFFLKNAVRIPSALAFKCLSNVHRVPKNVHLLSFEYLCQQLTDFNDFLPVKSWENLTRKSYRLSTSPVRCSHFTLGNPKKSFSTVLFTHTSDYLRYLTWKQSVIHLPTPPENVTTPPARNNKTVLSVSCQAVWIESAPSSPLPEKDVVWPEWWRSSE